MIEIINLQGLEKIVEEKEIVVSSTGAAYAEILKKNCRKSRKNMKISFSVSFQKLFYNSKFEAAINEDAYDIRKKYSIASFPTW